MSVVVPNTRWLRHTPAQVAFAGYESATAATDRLLLLKLSELRHHLAEAKRIEAEIAPLARAFADARGEYILPKPDQLRMRLGVPS